MTSRIHSDNLVALSTFPGFLWLIVVIGGISIMVGSF